jgi:hypothetical protein
MHVVKIIGGLGNQMFQYAFYKKINSIYRDCKVDVTEFENYPLHNGYEIERIFAVSSPKATKQEKNKLSNSGDSILQKVKRFLFGKKASEYHESSADFNEKVFQLNQPTYFDGYWQSEKYFKGIEEDVRKDFTFKGELSDKNHMLANEMQQNQSISIHVRRGDYIGNDLYEGICDLNYYNQAIQYIRSKVESPTFYIFSNDISWCRENLELLDFATTYVDWNKKTDSYLDMYLMSNCKYNIIANSSFSWWGAWLNNYENKIVVAPKKWVNNEQLNSDDIVPQSWVRL